MSNEEIKEIISLNEVIPIAKTQPDFNNSYLHSKIKKNKSNKIEKELSKEDNLAQLEKELESFF